MRRFYELVISYGLHKSIPPPAASDITAALEQDIENMAINVGVPVDLLWGNMRSS